MSPVPGSRRDRWVDFDRPAARRIDVEGGVAVPRTWRAAGEEAVRLVVTAEGRTTAGIASRGWTYARKGQVVEVRLESGRAAAAIQGSDASPYSVSLAHEPDGDLAATCTCPYGCDEVEWCKHAAALAFVVAHLVDSDAALARAWSGDDRARDDRARDNRARDGRVRDNRARDGRVRGDDDGIEATADAAAARAQAARLAVALRADRHPPDTAARWAAALEVLPMP